MNNVVVFGTNGQVARALMEYFPEATFVSRADCDFEKPDQIAFVLNKLRPQLVINPAAYTEVDKAETEVTRALTINAEAPSIIAVWCAANKAALIHYSTDYVYAGTGEVPWLESDPVGPQNQYGASKLAGEVSIQLSGCQHIILRTSWVYDSIGKNFLTTMIRLGRERELLKIVSDQIGAPTYAGDIAKATRQIADSPAFGGASGVYNLVNTGATSWYGFASLIFEVLGKNGFPLKVVKLDPILSSEYPTPAKRPLNSRMNTQKLQETFNLELRPWEMAVRECLSLIAKSKVN